MLFTFGAAVFYVLLAIERRVWAGSLTFGGDARGTDEDVRLIHRVLKHLIPALPPSNGVVVAKNPAKAKFAEHPFHALG